MSSKPKETTIVLCDNLIKLYLRGYSKNEMTKTFNIADDTFEDCVQYIKDKFGLDLQAINQSLGLKVP